MYKYSDDLSYDDDDDEEEIPSPPGHTFNATGALQWAHAIAIANAKADADWHVHNRFSYPNQPPQHASIVWRDVFLNSLHSQGFTLAEYITGPQGPAGALGMAGTDGKCCCYAPDTARRSTCTVRGTGPGSDANNWRPTLRYPAGSDVLYNGFLWRATLHNRANIDPPGGVNTAWEKV